MHNHAINLARSLVWTARQRCLIYRTMLVYFLVVSILLVVASRQATCLIQAGLELKRDAQALQQRMSLQYPDQPVMETQAAQLKDKLQKQAGQAAAIHAALPSTVYSSIALLNLLADPLQSGRLSNFSFDQKGGKQDILFSVVNPDETAGDSAASPAFLQQWRKDPVLTREFIAITPVTTERSSIRSERVSIRKYKAVFRE